jgi:hypothetical protein
MKVKTMEGYSITNDDLNKTTVTLHCVLGADWLYPMKQLVWLVRKTPHIVRPHKNTRWYFAFNSQFCKFPDIVSSVKGVCKHKRGSLWRKVILPATANKGVLNFCHN